MRGGGGKGEQNRLLRKEKKITHSHLSHAEREASQLLGSDDSIPRYPPTFLRFTFQGLPGLATNLGTTNPDPGFVVDLLAQPSEHAKVGLSISPNLFPTMWVTNFFFPIENAAGLRRNMGNPPTHPPAEHHITSNGACGSSNLRRER